jgi:hypothetical protein
MTQLTQEEREAVEAMGWTEEELAAFAQALTAFRDGLPQQQQRALDGIVAAAITSAAGEDTQGYRIANYNERGNKGPLQPLPPGGGGGGAIVNDILPPVSGHDLATWGRLFGQMFGL